MAVPTFYLQTSVWGSLAPRQPRDRKNAVLRLLKKLDGVRGQGVVSALVKDEINAAGPQVTEPIKLRLIKASPLIAKTSGEVETLALAYVHSGVVSPRRINDAFHVATATVAGCTYLVSWNHRHMTRPAVKLLYQQVNMTQGYDWTPLICNPLEACNELRS